MKTSQAKTGMLGAAITSLLLGAVAPNLHAQDVQYTKPKDNVVQAQPHRTAPHYYTAHSNAPPNTSAVQLICPPGTFRNADGRCVTIPRDPHRQQGPAHRHIYATHSNVPPNVGAMHPVCPPNTARNSQGRCVTIPRDPHRQPAPIEHHSSASNTHGIIFVGGKNALNPQPIPPGHPLHANPHPGAPIETGGH